MIRIGIEIAVSLVLALLLRRFVCAFAFVKGKSMMDTLNDKEIIFVLRYGLFGEPQRFDVVLCRYPNRKGLFVKRIIGMPGETISMEEDVIYINGEPIQEDFARRSCMRMITERTLEPDEYFVMGDHRNNSNDSRSIGPIGRDYIIGHVRTVVFPFNHWRGVK